MLQEELTNDLRRLAAELDELGVTEMGGPCSVAASPMRTKVKWVKSLWRFPHSVPKCLIYVALLFAVKAAGPACIL